MKTSNSTAENADAFRIRNWKHYQHYKDRNPPWIKLHYELLSSRDWVTLDDASRVLAVASMLIASRNDGTVPNDPDYIQRVAYLKKKPDFGPLVSCGFFEAPNTSMSTPPQTPPLEREDKETEYRDRDRDASKVLASASKVPFGEMKSVRLTEDEHAKLIAKHGEQDTALAIEILDGYIAGKGKRYASHYATMKEGSWVWDRVLEIKAKTCASTSTARLT